MPRIHDRLLGSALYLYESEKAADTGSEYGASGFLIGVPSDAFQGKDHIYAVTNAHVIAAGYTVLRLSTRDGQTKIRPTKGKDWTTTAQVNGYDLAVTHLGVSEPSNYPHLYVSAGVCLRKDDISSIQIGPGDDAFMVGRFVAHDGEQRNAPSARFGHISMMPDDDAPVLQTHSGVARPCYLVEMHSISGYSGSPVFFHRPYGERVPMDDDPMPERRMREAVGFHERLLGIDCGHFSIPKRVDTVIGTTADGEPKYGADPKMNIWYDANSGQATVVPAWILSDLLHGRELTMVRRQIDDQA